MEVVNLIRTLYQTIGNKRYMHSIEILLQEKLKDLTPEQKEALRFLASDLTQLKMEGDRKRRMF